MDSVKTNLSLPFNSYDFFGYILPGTLFSLGLFFILKDCIDLTSFLDTIKNVNTVFAILISLGALALLYFVGQIVGCFSHLLYDRLMVRNIIGYPFQYILSLKPRPDDSVRITYLLFILSVLSIMISPEIYEFLISYEFTTVHYGWVVSIVFSSIFVVLFAISFVLRILLVFSKMRRMNNSDAVIRKANGNSIENDGTMKKICSVVARLSWYVFFPLRKITSTDTKIHPEMRKRFISKMKEQTGVDLCTVKEYTSDAYWMTYISLLKSDVKHDSKIGNWLNLYGCLRNYSCAFFLLIFIGSVQQWMQMIDGCVNLSNTKFILISFVLGTVLFIRYWIIYFSYFTKYIIRAYVLEGNS